MIKTQKCRSFKQNIFLMLNIYKKSNLLVEIVAYKYIPTTIGYRKMSKKRKTNEGITHRKRSAIDLFKGVCGRSKGVCGLRPRTP